MVNTPRIMKKFKRALPVAMAIVLGSTAAPLVVRADSSKLPMQMKENIWKGSLPTNKSVPVPTAVLM